MPDIDNVRPHDYDRLRVFIELEIKDQALRDALLNDLINFAKDEAVGPISIFVDEETIRRCLRENRGDYLENLTDRIDDVDDDEASSNYNPCIFIFGHTHIPEYYGDHEFEPPNQAGTGALASKMAYINTGAWMPTIFLDRTGHYRSSPQPLECIRPFACVSYGPKIGTREEEIFATLSKFLWHTGTTPRDYTDGIDIRKMDEVYRLFGIRGNNDEDAFWRAMKSQ